jgi:hypothetical protein
MSEARSRGSQRAGDGDPYLDFIAALSELQKVVRGQRVSVEEKVLVGQRKLSSGSREILALRGPGSGVGQIKDDKDDSHLFRHKFDFGRRQVRVRPVRLQH